MFEPSGRNPEDGTAYMVDGMKRMLHWHRDAFSVFPVGQGHDVEVNDFDDGVLVVPGPPTSRAEIQEPGIRESEVPPSDYYPEGYEPLLLTEWPVDGDLVVPLELFPTSSSTT